MVSPELRHFAIKIVTRGDICNREILFSFPGLGEAGAGATIGQEIATLNPTCYIKIDNFFWEATPAIRSEAALTLKFPNCEAVLIPLPQEGRVRLQP